MQRQAACPEPPGQAGALWQFPPARRCGAGSALRLALCGGLRQRAPNTRSSSARLDGMPSGKPATSWALMLAALLPILGAVVALGVPLIAGPPSLQELSPAEGRLVQCTVIRSGTKSPHHYALMKLEGQPGRFWSEALRDAHAHDLDRQEGSMVRVLYVQDWQGARLGGDAVKSYGLWVNGVEIVSLERSLASDRFGSYVLIPLLGALISGIGLWRFLVIRRELRTRGSARPSRH
jgi:hypothetical protein